MAPYHWNTDELIGTSTLSRTASSSSAILVKEATPAVEGKRATTVNPVEAAYVKLPGVVNASQQSDKWQDWAIEGDGGTKGEQVHIWWHTLILVMEEEERGMTWIWWCTPPRLRLLVPWGGIIGSTVSERSQGQCRGDWR